MCCDFKPKELKKEIEKGIVFTPTSKQIDTKSCSYNNQQYFHI